MVKHEQEKEVEKLLDHYLDLGINDKQAILTAITRDLNIPRPTVRRIVRDIRAKWMYRIEILRSDIPGILPQ